MIQSSASSRDGADVIVIGGGAAGIMAAITGWGYQPSEVERILLGEEPQSSTEACDEASDSAA